jgi:hypothetical protein
VFGMTDAPTPTMVDPRSWLEMWLRFVSPRNRIVFAQFAATFAKMPNVQSHKQAAWNQHSCACGRRQEGCRHRCICCVISA